MCESYAAYRRLARQPSQRLPKEDADAIRNEILATLYAIGWYRHHSRIRPDIALMNSYSPIRVDIGSDGAVLTVANSLEPALLAPKGSFLYTAVKDEIEQASLVLPRVEVPADSTFFPADRAEVSGGTVESALAGMIVFTPGAAETESVTHGMGTVDFQAVADRVFAASPY